MLTPLTSLAAAKVIDIDGSIDGDTRAALREYLAKYLEFLRRAGNHVLFDLPDFDDDKYTAHIDYSQHRESLDLDRFCGGVTVSKIDLSDLNEQLAKKWMAAQRLWLVGVEDKLAAALSVFSTQWCPNISVDANFYIEFRAPRVKALCSYEVILYFDIAKIWFFDGEITATYVFPLLATRYIDSQLFSAKYEEYENWSVAFIVNVLERKAGSITDLVLDFESEYHQYSLLLSV